MKRNLFASSVLATLTIIATQASFAEESPVMQQRMSDLARPVVQQQQTTQQQSVEAASKQG